MAMATAASSLYDSHARAHAGEAQSLREERESVHLNRFHNSLKRAVLVHFAAGATSLLDLACGRGGDMHKWVQCDIARVVACDVSSNSLDEAEQRWNSLEPESRGRTRIDWTHADLLSDSGAAAVPTSPTPSHRFDVATCFFALHYFCERRESLARILSVARQRLREGGTFIVCMPSAAMIARYMNVCANEDDDGAWEWDTHAATLALPDGRPRVRFGELIEFAIRGTVVAGHSLEFLAWPSLVEQVARECGFEAVRDWPAELMSAGFDARDDARRSAKHFFPTFDKSVHESWTHVSRLNCMLVFRRLADSQTSSAHFT